MAMERCVNLEVWDRVVDDGEDGVELNRGD